MQIDIQKNPSVYLGLNKETFLEILPSTLLQCCKEWSGNLSIGNVDFAMDGQGSFYSVDKRCDPPYDKDEEILMFVYKNRNITEQGYSSVIIDYLSSNMTPFHSSVHNDEGYPQYNLHVFRSGNVFIAINSYVETHTIFRYGSYYEDFSRYSVSDGINLLDVLAKKRDD